MLVLVIEDNAPLRTELCAILRQWKCSVRSAGSGRQGLQQWEAAQPDLVVLDLGLPDIDGLDVLQEARRLGLRTPVLLLTARCTVADRVLGLNLGADSYLVKPYDPEELRARIFALMRRSPPLAMAREMPRELGGLSWSAGATAFHCGRQRLMLSAREAALLRALVQQPNRALSSEQLLQAVFPQGNVQDQALEVVAHRLRKRLAACGVAVQTLRGLGYLIKARTSPPPGP
jgi:two-component system, OmpR family, response regulator TctD